jgi:hypothetical protein
MHAGRNLSAARPVILLTVIAALILLSLASGAWASPSQSGLRQTVPTRTPTKMPTPTSLPPTAEPTPIPPTPVPPTAEPTRPTANPTQGPATAVPTPTEPPQATRVVTTEFPKTGADFTPWIKASAALISAVLIVLSFLRLRRTIAGR